MAYTRRLLTDRDFAETMEREARVRIFRDDHVIEAGGVIIRFTDDTVVTQTGVGDITHHPRALCEFFEMRKR